MGSVENIRKNLQEFDIINPAHIYNGDLPFYDIDEKNPIYDISKDILYLNAIEEKGKNKYEEFLNKYFFSRIGVDRISPQARVIFTPFITTEMNSNGDGRHLVIRADYIALNMYANDSSLRKELAKDGQVIDSDHLADLVAKYYEDHLNKVKDYKLNRLRSKYAEYFIRYAIEHTMFGGEKYKDKPLSQSDLIWIDKQIGDYEIERAITSASVLLDIINKVKHEMALYDEREKGEYQEQMQKDFMDCFVYDKFAMCLMKKVIDQQKFYGDKRKKKLSELYSRLNVTKDETEIDAINREIQKYLTRQEVSSAIIEVAHFFKIIDKENVKYTQSIKYYDAKQKKVLHYNTNDLRNDFRKYEKLFDPEDKKMIDMPLSQYDALGLTRNFANTSKFEEFLQKKDEEALIEAGWELLAPGQQVKDVRGYAGRKPRLNNSFNPNRITDEEVEKRKFAFSKTNYSRQLVGRDKFDGYIGYLYRNGLVLFERYIEEGGLKNNATYVMNIDNFIEFSKKTKTQIMDIIKNGSNTEVRRLYHTDTWEERLTSIIGSIPETEESVMRVESLPSYGRK